MQMREAAKLRQEVPECPAGENDWAEEYDLGAQTGDLVCRVCGKCISIRDPCAFR